MLTFRAASLGAPAKTSSSFCTAWRHCSANVAEQTLPRSVCDMPLNRSIARKCSALPTSLSEQPNLEPRVDDLQKAVLLALLKTRSHGPFSGTLHSAIPWNSFQRAL